MKQWVKKVALWVGFCALAAVGVSSRVSADEASGPGTCAVCGHAVGAGAGSVALQHEGREMRFCSQGCAEKFQGDPAGYVKKVDEAMIAQQKDTYPLTTCVVSGDALGGEMGEPVDYVYNNRLVRFCCKGCIKQFEKDPATYLSKIDRAIVAAQKDAYPLDTCVVSGEKLGPTAVDYVYGNQLVRFCCSDCKAAFAKNPMKYMAKISAANTERVGK